MGNLIVQCDSCGRNVHAEIAWDGDELSLAGAVLPIGEGLETELFRRKMGGLCLPCWNGEPPPEPEPRPKVRIYMPEDL